MMQRAGQILVQRAILKQEADRLDLQVSDEDLRRELQTGPFAQYLFPTASTSATMRTSTSSRAAFGRRAAPTLKTQVKGIWSCSACRR